MADDADDHEPLLAELERLDADTVEIGPDEAAAAPARIRRFALLERIGEGGMGVVYTAYDARLDRKVALKVLRREESPRARARFTREARALARLSHPNVVSIYDAGEVGERPYLAMALIDGTSVRGWLEARTRTVREILHVFLEAGKGLAAAHAAGLVHRDVKPDNILVARDGSVRVADFGLVRDVGDAGESDAPERDDGINTVGVGTPRYMAPEQHAGRVDLRSDQYAFCVSLREALGDRRAPPFVRRVLERGTRRDPAERYPDMGALLRDLGRDPGRSRRLAAAAVATVALVGGTALLARRDEQVCVVSDAEVRAIWPDRRPDVERAFTASAAPSAPRALATVDRTLTTWADGWRGQRRAACEATRVRREQSEALLERRQVCLDEQRADAAALIRVLAEADRAVVEKTLDVLGGLPDVTRCADLRALEARVAPPPAALGESAGRVRRALDEANARFLAGRYAEALAALDAVAAEPAAIGYPPAAAELLESRGELELRSGKLDAAASSLGRAYMEARRISHDEVALRAASDMVDAVGIAQNQFDRAGVWIDLARAEVGRLARGGRDEARLLLRIGTVEQLQGHYAEAEKRFAAAQSILDASGEADSPLAAELLLAVGTNQSNQGANQRALETFLRQLALVERTLGPDHPARIGALIKVGMRRAALGQHEQSVATLREAVALATRLFGEHHIQTARARVNLGLALYQDYQFAEAIREYDQALPVNDEVYGKDHPNTATLLMNRGLAYLETGRVDDALADFRRALEINRKAFTGDHLSTARSLTYVGWALERKHRCAEALAPLEESMAMFERAAPGSESVVETLDELGYCLNLLGRPREAIAPLEKALARVAKEATRLDPLARTEVNLGAALWDGGGDRRRAHELVQKGRADYAAVGEKAKRELDQADAWLARHARPTR